MVGPGGWAALLLALSAVWLWASGANIAPNAVTRATQGYNTYTGELAFLTDGLTPDNSDQAGVFAWETKGNLIFQFETPETVAGIRLRVGSDAGSYAVLAYLGAKYGKSGQTETTDEALVADVYDFDFQPNTWVDLTFPADTVTDYIELVTESGAEFYEIENLLILGRVTSGAGGELILEKAAEVLQDEFPQLGEQITMTTPDEQMKRHGQAVAAASLPTLAP